MLSLRKFIILLAAILIIIGCKQRKKISLAGDEQVELSDFIEFFTPVELPFQFSDTVLQRKEKDSLLISYKIFTQFVPDSVLAKVYGKGVKPKIYALGKSDISKVETYLFVITVSNNKKAFYTLCFDKKNKFITALAALEPENSKATLQSVLMDKKYTITKTVIMKKNDGSTSEGKEVYVFNTDAKNFMLIMTDALNDKVTELINPIDTLPRKNKFSGDYANGKMNLVSIRDGRSSDRITFFIHFEKNKGECTGELKGDATFKSPTTAEYRRSGDPCILKFIFNSSSVMLKEEEGCGSRRDLNCAFDGSFARKKNVNNDSNLKTPGKK